MLRACPQENLVVDVDLEAVIPTFLGEAEESLAAAEAALLTLEERPRDEEALGNAFRIVHSLKGNAGFLGFDAARPIPVVVCSGHAEEGSDVALRALEEGAVEVVAKPKLGVRDFLYDSSVIFFDAIRGAAQARLGRLPASPSLPSDVVVEPCACPGSSQAAGRRIVAMGASTGGTEALRSVLGKLPEDAPGIVIVMHMPPVFSAAFASRLNQHSRLSVKEAEDGERVHPGRALVAPGDRHLLLKQQGEGYVVELRDGPLVSRHRPSVDVLFRSVAKSAGSKAIGVLLTGMGSDGAQGLLELRATGALTVAQDEATSVVYGMPKEAVALGAVDRVLPLTAIPAFLVRRR